MGRFDFGSVITKSRFDFDEKENKTRFDFGIPDLQPSAQPEFAGDIKPQTQQEQIKNPITPGMLDVLTGGLSLEEADRFKEASFEEIPTFEDIGKTVSFISNPLIAAKDITKAIKSKSLENLSEDTKGTLKTLGFMMKTIGRIPFSAGAAIGAAIDGEDAQGVAREAVKGFLLPEDVDSIVSRVPFSEFERGGEGLGAVARLIPRATAEAIELVILFELTLGLPSKIRGAIRAPKELGVERDIDKLYKAIEGKKPQIIEAVEQQGRFPKGATFAEKSEFFDVHISVSKARAKLDPVIREQLFKRQTFGKLFKERFEGIRPPDLRGKAGQAEIPFSIGDIVKIGEETGEIIRIQGTKAILNIAGKEVTKELVEIKRLSPEELIENPPKTATPEEIVQRAFAIFGKTTVPESAGFITKSGEFIDSSGQTLGASGEGRNIDHREIASDSLPETSKAKTGSESLIEFQNITESIRLNVSPEDVFVDFIIRPTKEQFNSILELWKKREAIVVDITNKNGDVVESGEFKTFGEFKNFVDNKLPPEKPLEARPPIEKEVVEPTTETKAEIKKIEEESISKQRELVVDLKNIDTQMRTLESAKKRLEKQNISTKQIDQKLNTLSKEFIFSESSIAELMTTPIDVVKIEDALIVKNREEEILRIENVLSEGLPTARVKPIIKEVTGVKKIEKVVTTTERAELKRKLRLINKSIKEGIREGVSLEKVRVSQREAIKLIRQFDKTRDQINAAIDLEEAFPEPLESKSSAFNEHITYFQTRQIPQGSAVRGLLARIRAIDRLRRSKKIKAGQANRITRKLRRELFNQADKEGVAIRMTPGGKIILAVRESGVFVPIEFAEYKHFKNVSSVAGGGTDTTRMIENIDGALSVAQKKGLPGQAGQAVQQVLWPTRDMMIQKMSYIEEKLTALREIFSGIKGDSPESELITKVAEQIGLEDLSKTSLEILQKPEVNALSKSQKIVTSAKDLRVWFTDMIEEINAAREIRNQDLIPVRDKYIPHEFLDQILWEQHGISTEKPSDVFEGQGNLPSYIKPNKPFNPREKAREFGIPYDKRLLDSVSLAENYIATAAKDIFNTSIIQNNKAFIQQLEAMGFNKSAKTIGDWNAEAFAGIRPVLDNAVNLPEGWTRGLNYFNRLRNMAVFPFNFSWNLLTQTSSFTVLTLTRSGLINTVKGLTSWTINPKLREQTAKDYFSFIVKSHKQGRLSRQDVTNLIGQDIKIYRKPSEVLEDWGTLFGDSIEKLLTGASIEAARLTGIQKGLTGKALKEFASDSGFKTQSDYSNEGKPGVLRSTLVKTVTPYQTFTFEVVNTFREWLGKTGTPPDDATERILWMIRFIAGVTVSSAIAMKGGKKLWSWFRAPLPFAEYWLNPVIKALTGEYTDGMGSLPSPTQAVSRMAKGINDYLETGSTRKFRNEVLRWAPGLIKIPGGVQISRTVDGWIGYADGGIYNRSGRRMFGIETEEDLLRGMFTGVWSTKGGQEYLKKRESKLDFNIDTLLDDLLGIDTGKRRKRIKRSKRQVRERRKRTRRFKF